MTAMLVKHPDRFSEARIDGEVVLLDLAEGTFFSLTGTAAAIWPLIDGRRDRAALLMAVAREYGAEPAEIAADLDAFLGQLTKAGFVIPG